MSTTAANDEDQWQIESIEESQQQISQEAEDIQDESNASVRRSSRLASKSYSPPSIIDWPLPKLLETLYRHDIPAPTGATHKELFALLCEKIDVPAADFPPPPPFSGRKQAQKRKNFDPASTPTDVAPKRAGGSAVSNRAVNSSSVQSKDPVLSALSSIQFSLSNMNSRIQALESGSTSRSSANLLFSGPLAENSSSATAPARLPVLTQQQDDDVINSGTIPRRTMGSAVPVSTGSPFFPPAAAISHQLRSQIVAGNDVNLVKILLCSEMSEKRVVDCGDVSVMLKDSDPRLSKMLTLAEFNVAFGVYRDVICEVYPSRRAELDTYLAIISDLALTYGGTLFYDYHKSFSAKAAMFIQRFNQRLDWSVVDLTLISRHFTGHQALACSICGSHSHTLNLCPKSVSPPPSKPGFQTVDSKVTSFATPLCYNFNENVCKFYNCKYVHACSYCGDGHPKSVCPRRTRFMKKEKKK